MKKSLKQQFKEFWNVEPYKCNPENHRGVNGEINQESLKESQERMNKLAKEEQFSHRLSVVFLILAVPFIICVVLFIWQAILCLGLLLGCIGLLLK